MVDANVPLPSVRPTRRRRALRWALRAVGLVLLLVLLAAGWVRIQLGRSLPLLDGERQVAGLSATVTITRDALGVPTVSGATRQDVARALGFVHAQDRFFQMDLARRRSAGETLGADRGGHPEARRADARAGIPSARAAGHRAGDRRGARAHGRLRGGCQLRPRRPWDRSARNTSRCAREPEPWKAEDCVLVLASMFLQLQDAFGVRETRIGLLYDALPRSLADFVTSTASDWETPLSGPARLAPEVPGADVFDLRGTLVPAADRRLPSTASEPRGIDTDDAAAMMACARSRRRGPVRGVGQRRHARQQQLGRERGAHRQPWRDRRRRHASRPRHAQHLVPRIAGLDHARRRTA